MRKLMLIFTLFITMPVNALEFFESKAGAHPRFIELAKSSKSLLPAQAVKQKQANTLKKVIVRNNSILEKKQVISLVKPFINQDINEELLNTLTQTFVNKYEELGYIHTEIEIAATNYQRGIVVLEAKEVNITRLAVVGNQNLSNQYLTTTLASSISGPLNITHLNAALANIQSSPEIESLSAQLVPLNDSRYSRGLLISVKERRSYYGSIQLNNYNSRYLGSEVLAVNLGKFNLTGRRDTVGLAASASSHSSSYALNYQLPINHWQSELSVYSSFMQSRLDTSALPQSLKELSPDVNGNTQLFGLSWSWLPKAYAHALDKLYTGLESAHVQNNLLGLTEYDLTSKLVYFGASSRYSSGNLLGVIDFQLRYGFDLQQKGVLLDSHQENFTTIRLTSMNNLKIERFSASFHTHWKFQYALNDTSRSELQTLTGASAVRGYHESGLASKNALITRNELQKRLTAKSTILGFVDVGLGSNSKSKSSHKLASIGAGINWTPLRRLTTNAIVGVPLIEEGDLARNYGVHFEAKYQF